MFISKATVWMGGLSSIQNQILATRLSFFSLGFATAAWAPLIPLAQQRLYLNHANFGLLLLCAGIGSFLSMPVTGALIQKVGCRVIIGFSLVSMLCILPLLSVLTTTMSMAVVLFLFGTVIGSLGVAMNMQAILVEKKSMANMMSSFHGLCSLGGLIGVALVSTLLVLGVSPLLTVLSISFMLLIVALCAIPQCLARSETTPTKTVECPSEKLKLKSLLHRPLLLIGFICFIGFLSEGAAMDWSGIYLVGHHHINSVYAGFAYTCFAIAMTFGRFSGNFLLQKLGSNQVVIYGAVLATLGLIIIVAAPHWSVVLLGYALVGLGSSNIVPIMFSRVGNQTVIPKAAALSMVSTMAYSGSLLGPALVGFMSEIIGLAQVFVFIAFLLASIALLNQFTLHSSNIINKR